MTGSSCSLLGGSKQKVWSNVGVSVALPPLVRHSDRGIGTSTGRLLLLALSGDLPDYFSPELAPFLVNLSPQFSENCFISVNIE